MMKSEEVVKASLVEKTTVSRMVLMASGAGASLGWVELRGTYQQILCFSNFQFSPFLP